MHVHVPKVLQEVDEHNIDLGLFWPPKHVFTNNTIETSISAVSTQVSLEVCRLRELRLTICTSEGLFTSMST